MKYVEAGRSIRDAVRKLGVKEQDVFTMWCAMCMPTLNPKDLWQYFRKTATIPEAMIDFLIDTLCKKKGAA